MEKRHKHLDISGLRIGMLVAETCVLLSKHSRHWILRCDCGGTKTMRASDFATGRYQSCGCNSRLLRSANGQKKRTHGQSRTVEYPNGTPTYRSWLSMMKRCFREWDGSYARYGGRGITVCERWRSFENFCADMGERPKGMTLDRINNDGNYELGNCRWSTLKTQGRNTSAIKLSEHAAMQIRWLRSDGGFSREEVANAFGVQPSTITSVTNNRTWFDGVVPNAAGVRCVPSGSCSGSCTDV